MSREIEPSYWHHPMADIEPPPDYSCRDEAEAIRGVFGYITGQDPKGAFVRFMAIAWLLDPDTYFEGRDQVQAAALLGLDKQAFNAIVIEACDALKIRNRYMRREGARESYAERQRGIWADREKAKDAVQTFLNV